MKLTPQEIAQVIVSTMRAQDLKVMTMKWSRLYEFSKRERVTNPFLENLSEALRQEGFVMAKGIAVVSFLIDYDFAPVSQESFASAAASSEN